MALVKYDKSEPIDIVGLKLELLASLPGVECSPSFAGPPLRKSDEQLWITYTPDLDAGQLATAAAIVVAHDGTSPIEEGIAGSVAIAKGVPFLIGELPVKIGDVVWVDVHLLCTLGDVDNFEPEAQDSYFLAWRESTGSVQTTGPEGTEVGRIPGFELSASGTVDTVRIEAVTRKAGTLTVLESSVEVKEQGNIS